jgi:hypothetical protein
MLELICTYMYNEVRRISRFIKFSLFLHLHPNFIVVVM